MTQIPDPTRPPVDEAVLRSLSQRVLWLSAAIVDAANRGRPNASGVKVRASAGLARRGPP
jgi:pyruvate dehydrogenase E1 component